MPKDEMDESLQSIVSFQRDLRERANALMQINAQIELELRVGTFEGRPLHFNSGITRHQFRRLKDRLDQVVRESARGGGGKATSRKELVDDLCRQTCRKRRV